MNDLLQKEREELYHLLKKMGLNTIDCAVLLDERSSHDKRVLEKVGEMVGGDEDMTGDALEDVIRRN